MTNVISSTFMVKLLSSVIAMLRVAMLCPAPAAEGATVENLSYTTPPPTQSGGGETIRAMRGISGQLPTDYYVLYLKIYSKF